MEERREKVIKKRVGGQSECVLHVAAQYEMYKYCFVKQVKCRGIYLQEYVHQLPDYHLNSAVLH